MTRTSKNLFFIGVFALIFASWAVFAVHATVITPTLSLTAIGNGSVQITVNGDSNAPINLYYYTGTSNSYGAQSLGVVGYTANNGTFSTTLSSNQYNISAGSNVYVVVNGQSSSAAYWPNYNSYSNGGYNGYQQYPTYSSYPNPAYPPYQPYPTYVPPVTYPPLSLDQGNLSLVSGESQSIGIYGTGSYFIYSNTNSSVATASVNGSSLSIYASNPGTTSITVCESVGSSCVITYITVMPNIPAYVPTTYSQYSYYYPSYQSYPTYTQWTSYGSNYNYYPAHVDYSRRRVGVGRVY